MGFDGEQVRTRLGEGFDARTMEGGVILRTPVIASRVLGAVAERRTIRADRPGDEDTCAWCGIAICRSARDAHAVADDPAALLGADSRLGEPERGCLVARGREHLRPSGDEGGVHGHQGVGVTADELGRPQCVVEVDAAILGGTAQPAVDDDGGGRLGE